jgi:HSP20 family protein
MLTTCFPRTLPNQWEQLHQVWDRLLSGSEPSQDFGAVNVSANADALHVEALLPGMSEEQLTVEVERDTLSLRAVSGEGESARTWQRKLQLPFVVEPNSVKARLSDGVLTIDLPRPESHKPQRITIHSA